MKKTILAAIVGLAMLALGPAALASTSNIPVQNISLVKLQAIMQQSPAPCTSVVGAAWNYPGDMIPAAVPAYVHSDEVAFRSVAVPGLSVNLANVTDGNGQPLQVRQTPFNPRNVNAWFQNRQIRYDVWAPVAGDCSQWVHYVAVQ